MRFKFLGTALGRKLYGYTEGRYSFVVTGTDDTFSAIYRDLFFTDKTVTNFIGDGYSTFNEAREACERKLKELTG